MKKTSHEVDSKRPEPTGLGGEKAPPDEKNEIPQAGAKVNLETLGPRLIIQQAARDIAQGLKDTDLHGIPSNVPGPVPNDLPDAAATPIQGGDRRSYADEQKANPKTHKK